MHLIAFIVLAAAALAFLLAWADTTPRRFASIPLGLCLFVIGVILVFVIASPDWRVTIGG
jgi:hypothetical protein